ncbi:MAG: trigger factor [Lachnospiraceae bacterium]|nr:trigger factor [Lachnospiraceae bacterium]
MMKKWIRVILCAAIVTLAVAGCKKKEAEETTEAPTESAAPVEIPEASVVLGEYKGISIADPYQEVTDEALEARIQQDLAANPVITNVDRPAENGDVVNIDYVGMKDGVPFERGADDNFDLTLGSNSFIEGFEEGLVGAKTGDELSLNLKFPDDYWNAEMAGQEVVFDVTVNAVKEQSEAELNDEFVQRVSEESKTVEEYRAELRKTMEDEAREMADFQLQNDVMEKVVENATFTGLDVQVDAQLNQEISMLESALSQQGGTLEDYAAMSGTDVEGLTAQLREEILSVTQLNLVTDAVAEKEGLKADDASRSRLAELNRVEDVTVLVTQYGQEAVDKTARRIRVMDFLTENAKVE